MVRLVHEGKTKAVFYNAAETISAQDLDFMITLEEDGKPYPEIHIPDTILAEANGILASFQRIPADQETGLDSSRAVETLGRYFDHLSQRRFGEAAALYGGSYDGLREFNPAVDPDDYPHLFQKACQENGFRRLLGDWAVQRDSFLTVYNRISDGMSGQVEISDMSGTMGAHFGDDHSFKSVNNGLQIVMRTNVPGEGEMDITWRIDLIGEALWFTDQEMTTLNVTESDLAADVAVTIPGVGEFSMEELSGQGEMGGSEGLFAFNAHTIAVGDIFTTAAEEFPSYSCDEETLTLHYPQFGDLVMDRLDDPIPLPNLEQDD